MEQPETHEVTITTNKQKTFLAKCQCGWNKKKIETRSLARAYSERHLLHNGIWPFENDEKPEAPWPN